MKRLNRSLAGESDRVHFHIRLDHSDVPDLIRGVDQLGVRKRLPKRVNIVEWSRDRHAARKSTLDADPA